MHNLSFDDSRSLIHQFFVFFYQELHAHINGSVSESTIEKLVAKKQKLDHQFSFKKGSTATLKE